jgi:N utilization substance protein A
MDNLKELLQSADMVAKEKGLDKEEVLNALAEGLETALRRTFPEGAMVNVDIDYHTGQVNAYRLFKLVDQIENVEAEMLNSEVEDELVEDGFVFEPFEFLLNRQQFNITKQVALQRIKNDIRDHQVNNLLDKPIALYSGTVKVVKKDQLIVDCSGLDVSIYRRSLLPKDNYKTGDKIYFTLEKEKNQYVGTRTSELYLTEVLKREIVQIEEGEIEIVACARNPGVRSKVVLKSNRPSIDPIKTAIGPKGTHIKNVHNFLNGEVVDLIAYDSDRAQLLINSINPVQVLNIVIDEELQAMDIAVPDDEVAQAIGRGGKNIEMIGRIVGWQINVFSESQWNDNEQKELRKIMTTFAVGLNCDDDFAQSLVEEGFESLEQIAYLPKDEFMIDGVDEETLAALRQNARDTLENPLASKKAYGAGELNFLGFSSEEIEQLQQGEVFGNLEVSELSTYDLDDVLPGIDETRAKQIILLARHKEEKNQSVTEQVAA